MGNVNVSLRVDETLKKQAEELFSELGLSLTTAVNIFLRQSVREGRIPFIIGRNTPYMAALSAMGEEKLYGPFDSVDALMESLEADEK